MSPQKFAQTSRAPTWTIDCEVMMMGEVSRMFTVPQVCDVLQMSRSKVYELLMAGVIPSVCIGRARRIPSDRLREYLDAL